MNKGLIISLIAGVYKVYDLDTYEKISCKPRGVMRIKAETPKVGDYVLYTKTDDQGIIEQINPRQNDLIRPYICNIDQAFVIMNRSMYLEQTARRYSEGFVVFFLADNRIKRNRLFSKCGFYQCIIIRCDHSCQFFLPRQLCQSVMIGIGIRTI